MGGQDLVLRRAERSDAASIRELTRAAYAKWVSLIGREPKPMLADYDEAVRNHRIDLLFSADGLIGLIEMISEFDQLLIENIAIAPGSQGRGYGRRLMAHAENVAFALEYRKIRLYTNKLFAVNITLYCKLGYRVDREEEFKGGTVVHMTKNL